MQNITQYKQSLVKVVEELNQFDLDSLDCNYLDLKKAFDIAYSYRVFDLTQVPKEEIDIYKLELFTALTQISGSLSFLAIQILAANSIMNSNNYAKKDIYVAKKSGIAINHLRAPITIVSGKKVDGGYELSGRLTWASGYEIFDTLVIGFHCGGKEYEVVSNFQNFKGFSIGKADKTFVGNSMHTVNIDMEDFFVSDENIISSKDMGNYTVNKSVSKTVHLCLYALGNSILKHIEDVEFKNKAKSMIEDLKDKFMSTSDPKTMDNLRVELFLTAQSIVSTAMALNGGKSILAQNSLQRFYRELIMFNSNGLNNNLKDLFKQKFMNA